MVPYCEISLARTLMITGTPTLVDAESSSVMGGKRENGGIGVMAIAGAFTGGQVRTPVMLPAASMNLNIRSTVGSCVPCPPTFTPYVGATFLGSIPSNGKGVSGCWPASQAPKQ